MFMADLSEILRLLQTERDRYILEAADLERRLSFIRQHLDSLEALISGYSQEEQIYQSYRPLPEPSSSKAVLEESHQEPENGLLTAAKQDKSQQTLPDISDIPKLGTARKPNSLPLLPEFQDYSIQNALLIVMRRLPDTHIHVDAFVRDLYGDNLTAEQFRTAKNNLTKILSMGRQAGLWYRVLDAQGVYTLKYEKGVTTERVSGK
jgi:hypothetical protein